MAQSVVLKGAEIKIFIAGKLYPEAQSFTATIDGGESEIFGIDSIFAQEIAITRMSIQGSITGVRVKLSGGLQGKSALTKINQRVFAPYVSIEVRDRSTDEKILFIPQCKVSAQTITAAAKGTVKLSFTFKGIIPYEPLDMN